MNVIESVVLEYIAGTSAKEYRVQLVETGGGFLVHAQHGRIGGTLNSADKATTPIPYAQAKRLYDATVQGKRRKGYKYASVSDPKAAQPAQAVVPVEQVKVDVPVMLLNPISEAQAQALIADPAWGMELKYDGERRLVVVEGADAYGVNRRGMKVPLEPAVRSALLAAPLRGRTVLDGEDVGGKLYVFDVLALDGMDLTDCPAQERIDYRTCACARFPGLHFATTAVTAADKAAMFASARQSVQEGVVFKRLAAAHHAGRPNSGGDALKCKFVESASFRVASVHATKRSVGLELLDSNGSWVGVGNVTIPANHAIPAAGAVVEVAYLYAYSHGSVFQPVYRGPRTDITADECLHSQLKFREDRIDPLPAAA